MSVVQQIAQGRCHSGLLVSVSLIFLLVGCSTGDTNLGSDATAVTKVSSNTVDCETESTLRSLESSVSTFINFTNSSTSPLQIYWLNYQGRRQHYESLKPSESYRQQTFVTHPWVVAELSGRCLAIYIPTEMTISAVLDSTLLE